MMWLTGSNGANFALAEGGPGRREQSACAHPWDRALQRHNTPGLDSSAAPGSVVYYELLVRLCLLAEDLGPLR